MIRQAYLTIKNGEHVALVKDDEGYNWFEAEEIINTLEFDINLGLKMDQGPIIDPKMSGIPWELVHFVMMAPFRTNGLLQSMDIVREDLDCPITTMLDRYLLGRSEPTVNLLGRSEPTVRKV